MSDALVEARNVSRSYRVGGSEIVALVDASCSIEAGARVALVGPSGSGKSTLLQILGGIDAPTGGAVRWPAFGTIDRLRPHNVAFVFQNMSLLAPLTVLENVELPLLLEGESQSRARAGALQMLESIELAGLAEKLPEELSGGQAQRVAFARALVAKTPLVLADEPTGQLDGPTAERLLDVVMRSLEGTKTALVIATHDRAVAARMEHRWSMEHGILRVSE
ncbi:MAG TPA: ABC transporter ATP-binding protein [Candidatus Baltobacteraceae bacterium]|jgi:putative ABC transport system ATP-binding protein/lipoprotein-releasing system ATP-binding protein